MGGLRTIAMVICVALVSGCAVGPNFVRPEEVAPPPEYRSQVGPAEAESIADLPWWEVFEDPVLQQLIRETIEANYDLQIAVHRVQQATELAVVARAPFYPQIGYQASAGKQSSPQFRIQPKDTYSMFFGALSLAWEFDIWGRIRRSNESAQQSLLSTEEFRRGVLLTVATSVAQSYLTLIAFDRELEITRETVESFQDTLDLFTRRYEGGIGDKLQVARAEAALASTQAQVPLLQSQITTLENAISALLGRVPGPIPRGTTLLTLPEPPATPPGLPSQLLERRPDILAAEHDVASVNAQVGVAVANFFPRIGLTTLYGGQSVELADIVKDNFSIWNVVGNVAGPLFQGFSLLGQYRAQKAVWKEEVARYEQTILNAFAEVSSTLDAQARLAEARVAQERSVAAYRESVRLALIRYDTGLANYFEVINAQLELYPVELTLAQIQRDELITVVTLYRALGGGWQLPVEEWSQ